MNFNTEKYKEMALATLMLEKQREFLDDSNKTF